MQLIHGDFLDEAVRRRDAAIAFWTSSSVTSLGELVMTQGNERRIWRAYPTAPRALGQRIGGGRRSLGIRIAEDFGLAEVLADGRTLLALQDRRDYKDLPGSVSWDEEESLLWSESEPLLAASLKSLETWRQRTGRDIVMAPPMNGWKPALRVVRAFLERSEARGDILLVLGKGGGD